MMNILKKIKINNFTYFFIIICALCGYIKNITIIFSICLIHELGHIIFIKLFKYEINSVEILPFGGYTEINKKINTSINKDLLIAFGGIIMQIILILLLNIIKNYLHNFTYQLIINYNYILIFFNLLPIIPLDGSQIMHLLLEKKFSYHLSYKLNLGISLVLLILFIYLNYKFHIDNYLIISFLFYQIIITYKNFKYYENRFLLERYLYDFNYKKIDNHTKSIQDLKKNTLHFFKEGNHYVREKEKIKGLFHHPKTH